jgi:arylsulfatase A-like enzyme
MNRRTFVASSSAAWLGRAQSKRPNLLFLLSDDQRHDLLGCAGHPILQTPNIDRLAAQGTRFRNNFCATAICCTSRASILTGLHEESHKISDFKTPLSPELEALSFPKLLRDAGYRTAFIGKYGVGGDAAPEHLFDKTYGPPGVESAGQSRRFGTQALDFLDSVRAQDNFSLCVHFRAPHARDPDPKQYLYDPEEAGLYRGMTMPLAAKAADPKYFERLPQAVRESESRVRWGWRFTSPEHYQESVRSYFRLIAGVDAVVGQILSKLASRGLAENTIVVYSSDNGYFLAERGLADKWYAYEESIRTPLIVFDPRVASRYRGQTRDEMTLNLDLHPTLLAAAGAKTPRCIQGRDLTPLVRGEKPAWRKEWFYSHLFLGFPPRVKIPKSEGLRTARWKYLRWIEESPLREEVYDLSKDPEEITDLSRQPIRAQLESRWRAWRDAVNAWTPRTVWRDPRA